MDREEMERHGALLFGYGWKARLADALDVNRKTISRWIAEDAAPPWAADRLREMMTIAPPPGSTDAEDRDDACAEALEPGMTRLAALAESSGWSRAEIAVAFVALSLSEIRTLAGDQAALDLLDQARAAIASEST